MSNPTAAPAIPGERVLTDLDFARLSKLTDPQGESPLADVLAAADVTGSRAIQPDVVTMNSQVEVADPHTGRCQVLTLCYPRDAAPTHARRGTDPTRRGGADPTRRGGRPPGGRRPAALRHGQLRVTAVSSTTKDVCNELSSTPLNEMVAVVPASDEMSKDRCT